MYPKLNCMLITRTSELTGKTHRMELDVTNQQMMDFISGRGLIQNIFPNLTPPEREFIKSGITPQEWEEMLTPPED